VEAPDQYHDEQLNHHLLHLSLFPRPALDSSRAVQKKKNSGPILGDGTDVRGSRTGKLGVLSPSKTEGRIAIKKKTMERLGGPACECVSDVTD
jgi:hypothetical protein